MDFSFSERDEQFRQKIKNWIDANLLEEWKTYNIHQYENAAEYEDVLKKWFNKLYEAGINAISWPKEYGGQDATLIEEIIFNQEMAKAFAPSLINYIGIHMVGPTLMHFGTEQQKNEYIEDILSGETIWCQGYSEPNAGSDLTAIQTRAIKRDDKWVINGQKVWTSFAHMADYCFLLARTSNVPEKRHKGITVFLVDMKQPGVQVLPIVSMEGEHHFNEVYFEDTIAYDHQIVGEIDEGWDVLLYLLMHERVGIGGTLFVLNEYLEKFVSDINGRNPELLANPVYQQELMKIYAEIKGALLNYYRNLSFTLANGHPGAESSLDKLIVSELFKDLGDFMQRVQGPQAVLWEEDAYINHLWQKMYLNSYGMTIGGGTSEIQRNTIAERVLGMPKDVR